MLARSPDCLRCDFLPRCHMASTEIRNRRRTLHHRNLVVKQIVQMKNRVSGAIGNRKGKKRPNSSLPPAAETHSPVG